MRVVQTGNGSRFALATIRNNFVRDFDRDKPIKTGVSGLVHLTHPTRTNACQYLEVIQPIADRERHNRDELSLSISHRGRRALNEGEEYMPRLSKAQ